MRRVALICSALLLIAAADADAQSGAKRAGNQAGTEAGAAAAAQKKVKSAKRGHAAKQAAGEVTPVEPRPRLKRDDLPTPVAVAPAAPPAARKKGHLRKPEGAPEQAEAVKAARATVKDIATCAQTKQQDAAIEGCTRIIDDAKQKPKARAAAFFNRGNASLAKGDHDKAIADFDEAIRLDSKNASALNNRGNARNEKGDTEAALADFDAAIKQNARYAAAYFNRANVFAAKAENARAIKDYDTAIRYNRRNVNAYLARGALMLATGAVAKARADMRHAAALDRKNAYTVLWQDIAERRAKHKGVLAGGKGLRDVEMKGWPAPVLLMFVGEIKQDAVLQAADNADPALKLAQTCEANFYGGQYALIAGQRDDAVKLFESAAKDCPHGFLERIAAAAELKGMGQKVGAN